MSKYPKIGIRPTIDGRQGGVRESLEEKTMNLAKAVAELISALSPPPPCARVWVTLPDGISLFTGIKKAGL